MANIQLRVCGAFGPVPEAVSAIDESVSPVFTTWLEPPAALGPLVALALVAPALALLPAPRGDAVAAAGSAGGGVGEIEEVSCAAGTSLRAIAPSCEPAPVVGAATGAFAADDCPGV